MDENKQIPNHQRLGTPTEEANNQQAEPQAQNIYPEVKRDINDEKNVNASQAFALQMMEKRAQESNKLVCIRVKAVIIVAVTLLLSSVYVIFSSLDAEYSGILISISLFQIVMALILLASKDVGTVGIILKIFLVFQVIGFGAGFSNPVNIAFYIIGLLILIYAYFSVKALKY